MKPGHNAQEQKHNRSFRKAFITHINNTEEGPIDIYIRLWSHLRNLLHRRRLLHWLSQIREIKMYVLFYMMIFLCCASNVKFIGILKLTTVGLSVYCVCSCLLNQHFTQQLKTTKPERISDRRSVTWRLLERTFLAKGHLLIFLDWNIRRL